MTKPTERLADILARENAALRAHRPQDVAPLLPEKEAALTALMAPAPAGPSGQADPPPQPAPDANAIRRLLALTAENEALLTEALAVQTQILALVARATRAALARNAPYGSRPPGRRAPPPPPLSMSKRF